VGSIAGRNLIDIDGVSDPAVLADFEECETGKPVTFMHHNQTTKADLEPGSTGDIYSRSVKGGFWLVALRVVSQVLNVVRLTVVLRILAPYDLGLLGIGTLMIGMVLSVTNLGLQTALVQRKDPTRGHLNCVWTAGLVRSVLLFFLIWFIAPSAARFFDGSGDFGANDITNYRAVAVRLRGGTEALDVYLRGEVSDETRRLLAAYDDSREVAPQLQRQLTQDFNRIVRDPALSRPENLVGIEISGYMDALVRQAPETRDLVRMNRRLLDEAFAGAIKRDIIDRQTASLVIRVLAITILLGGLSNVGTIYFTKELAFGKYFILQVVSELAATGATILAVITYRSVWGLVAGRIVGASCTCIASYVMHPFRPRPRFSWAEVRQLWHFGKHMIGVSMLEFATLHGDDILLGRMLGATTLGFYQQAHRIAQVVATEIGNKISQVALPAYSKLQDNLEKLRGGYFKTLQLSSGLVFPIAGGLIALAPEITEHVFGAKWLPMVGAMRILCLTGPLMCMHRGPVFFAVGRPDIVTRISAFRLVLLAIVVYPLTVRYGMVGTALSVTGTGFLAQPIGFYELERLVGAKTVDVLRMLAYPLAATFIMAAGVCLAKSAVPATGLIHVVVFICLGAAIYITAMLLLARISPQYDALASIRDIMKGLR